MRGSRRPTGWGYHRSSKMVACRIARCRVVMRVSGLRGRNGISLYDPLHQSVAGGDAGAQRTGKLVERVRVEVP